MDKATDLQPASAMLRIILIALVCLLGLPAAYAQSEEVAAFRDSVMAIWQDTTASYETRIDALDQVATPNFTLDPSYTIERAREMQAFAAAHKDTARMFRAMENRYAGQMDAFELAGANATAKEGVALAKAAKQGAREVSWTYNLAESTARTGNLTVTTDLLEATLKLARLYNVPRPAASAYQTLGQLAQDAQDFELAVAMENKTIQILDSLRAAGHDGMDPRLANSYDSKGRALARLERFEEALTRFDTAYRFAVSGNDKYGMVVVRGNLSETYGFMGELDKADSVLAEIIVTAHSMKADGLLMHAYRTRAQLALEREDAPAAVSNAEAMMRYLGNSQYLMDQQQATELLADCYAANQQWEDAYTANVTSNTLEDSLRNINIRDEVAGLNVKHEYAIKAQADSLEMARLVLVQDAERAQSQLRMVILFGGLALSVIIGLVLYSRFRVTRKQKGVIEAQAEQLERQKAQIQRDFLHLKDFTENAAHEMQTPMAVIRSKLEALLQSPDFSEEQVHNIMAVYGASGRLTHLNKSLLLLARIENKQYQLNEQVDYGKVVSQHLDWFHELMEHQELTVSANVAPSLELQSNPVLADTLVSNLLKNAIRHNVEGGSISVELTPKHLLVANTGKPINFDPATLFDRFQKGDSSAEGTGLGLAIVKEAVEAHGWQVHYRHNDGHHSLEVDFQSGAA